MIDAIYWILLLTRMAAFLYLLLMLLYMAGWQQVRRQAYHQPAIHPMLSIVVAMRNEAENIESLIKALAKQTYTASKLQIILVDDHSNDQTSQIAQTAAQSLGLSNIVVIENEGRGKKQALKSAFRHALGEWILFTDADCIPHESWAETMLATAVGQQRLMILGPVKISITEGWLQRFQAIETNSLIAATVGSAGIGIPSMANGANMALHRSVLAGDDKNALKPAFASGDDMFRLETLLSRYGSWAVGVSVLAGCMVSTRPVYGAKEFLAQRMRWVSKSKGYRRPEIIVPATVVFLFNVFLAVLLVLSVVYPLMLMAYLTFVLLKTLTDLPLVYPSFQLTGQKQLIPWFVFFQLFYPPYVMVIALASLWFPVRWKSRKLNVQI